MRGLGRLWPRSITAQVAWVIVIAVLFINLIGEIVERFVIEAWVQRAHPRATAARIETAVRLLGTARSLGETESLLTALRQIDVPVWVVPVSELYQPGSRPPFGLGVQVAKIMPRNLEVAWRLGAFGLEYVVVRLDKTRALAFAIPMSDIPVMAIFPATYAFLAISIFVLMLVLYAVRAVTAPLSRFAMTASAFGRSEAGDEMLAERGPREIALLATGSTTCDAIFGRW